MTSKTFRPAAQFSQAHLDRQLVDSDKRAALRVQIAAATGRSPFDASVKREAARLARLGA